MVIYAILQAILIALLLRLYWYCMYLVLISMCFITLAVCMQ